ncbi:Ubiquitin-conjugating enzyme E2 G1 [Merluccius polli]|uniref:Ubiquitin-conjugating enzyme E2 G1 n=1 Tax=Merluccius polli TaxID=89951 RepID=A0AA47MUE5_MERPO|nr:Ubiquitin-conjugating enzyme E2 G1 [Merluccius polli]
MEFVSLDFFETFWKLLKYLLPDWNERCCKSKSVVDGGYCQQDSSSRERVFIHNYTESRFHAYFKTCFETASRVHSAAGLSISDKRVSLSSSSVPVTLALSENAFSLLAFCPSRESIDRKDMAASIELARPMYILISDSSLRRIKLNKNPVEGFSAGVIDDEDMYKWEVVIIGPQDTLFEGGFFKAYLTFPFDYPLRPPKMKFITEIWHPNVAKNGDVCVSILHEPGEDKFGYEKPEERWLPIHTVETIMISVISMLADPNSDSPANVDAAWLILHKMSTIGSLLRPCHKMGGAFLQQKEWREDPNGEFKRKVARCVRKSQEMAFD